MGAEVPGSVYLDLMRVHNIPDPFFAKNVEKCKWVEGKDWWYRKWFFVPKDFVQDAVKLVFEGLDTYATIWLNGKLIGEHSNMFIPSEFDVTDKLKPSKKNLLVVKLASATKILETRNVSNFLTPLFPVSNIYRVYARKAQFTFWWDWAPRLVDVGIWRSVELKSHKKVSVDDVFVMSEITGEKEADLRVEITLDNYALQSQNIELDLTIVKEGEEGVNTPFKSYARAKVHPGRTTISKTLHVSGVEFWWPNGVGNPFLYRLKTEVKIDGEVLHEKTIRFGIREIKLVQKPDPASGTKSFTFVINGVKVFCKGANWVPADSIVTRVDEPKYSNLLTKAKKAHFNMLRIWGGGIYEDPTFYDLCDDLGIMIWQDFMFACADYPETEDFLTSVKKEVDVTIKQLRNHPCIVLWCGNNENDWLHFQLWKQFPEKYIKFFGKQIWHEIMPDACQKLDPTRPYWPSSPYGGEDPNSQIEGDRHSYQVFVGLNEEQPGVRRTDFDFIRYENYSRDMGKFISEFGILGVPEIETLRRFIPPEHLDTSSDVWRLHVASFTGSPHFQDILDTLVREYFGEISGKHKNIEDYVRIAQLVQCEGLKYGIEHFRRRKFDCSGTLFWSYDEAYPGVIWSIVDYYENEKASYYYVKRAYSPVLVSFKEEDFGISVWITNDLLKPIKGAVELRYQTFSGENLWEDTVNINIPSNSSVKIKDIPFKDMPSKDTGTEFFCARLREGDIIISQNQWFRRSFKDLSFPTVKLDASIKRVGSKSAKASYLVGISADKYARVVMLKIPGVSAEYTDNFFDMLPREEKLVEIVLTRPRKAKIIIDAINGEKSLILPLI